MRKVSRRIVGSGLIVFGLSACSGSAPSDGPVTASGGGTLVGSGGGSPISTGGNGQGGAVGGGSATAIGGNQSGGTIASGGAAIGGTPSFGGLSTGGTSAIGGKATGGNPQGGNSVGGAAKGGTTTGGAVNGGTLATGGNMTGGMANGGRSTGGNATGGTALGGASTGGTALGGASTGGASTGGTANAGGTDGGSPPVFTGPTVTGTVTVTRGTTTGRVVPGLATFSFEKTHLSDNFFTASHSSLINMFKLLGPSVMRIGANDVDWTTWNPSVTMLGGGKTRYSVGTAGVDALAAFLNATGWKVIYAVNMKNSTPSVAAAESTYVSGKLGSSLHSLQIGNEISFYGAVGTIQPQWDTFAVAIKNAVPNAVFAGPAVFGNVSWVSTFAAAEASKLLSLTYHYYRGAASSNPPLSQLLTIDPAVASTSKQLANIATSNSIREFRWDEMNSYSGHGAAGVSDVYGAALWGIDFMLTTAQDGCVGVHFHGGGQNQDNNICSNGVASCTKPFRYSPLVEVDSVVTAAAPLYYGLLLVSQAGTGPMLSTKVSAGNVNLTAYTIAPADGSTSVVLVNKDATNGVNASVNVGAAVTKASAVYLQAPSLTATTGITFAGSGVSANGVWTPKPAYSLPAAGNVVTLVVPPATAVVVRANWGGPGG